MARIPPINSSKLHGEARVLHLDGSADPKLDLGDLQADGESVCIPALEAGEKRSHPQRGLGCIG